MDDTFAGGLSATGSGHGEQLLPPPYSATQSWLITTASELHRLRVPWLSLLERSGSNELMLSPDWLLPWWDVFGPEEGRELRALTCWEGNRLIGLAPLLQRRWWHRGVLPLRRLEFVGSGEREEDGICSDYLNLICETGREEVVAECLARALATGALGDWDELMLPMMDGSGPMPAMLASAFRRSGMKVFMAQMGESRYAPLPATWDEYLRALTKKHRASVKTALRQFEEWAGPDLEIRRATSFEDLEVGKRALIELHAQRWNEEQRGGVFTSSLFSSFHERVLPRLLQSDALELAWLNVRGEPVAAAYNAVWNNKVYCYQCGRRPDLPPRARAGIYLNLMLMRDHIAAGRREYDFLGGSSQYKRQLASAVRPLVVVRVSRPGWRQDARQLIDLGVALARPLKQKLAPVPSDGPGAPADAGDNHEA